MATAGNIGGFLGGFNQTFWPMFQQFMQQKRLEQAQQEEQNRKYAYDASLGKLVPVNPSLTMLPGLSGSTDMARPRMISPLQLNTGVSPAAYMKQEVQPGATYIPGGMGVQGGYYTPKLAEDRDSFEYLQKLEKMKTDEGIRRDRQTLGDKKLVGKGFSISDITRIENMATKEAQTILNNMINAALSEATGKTDEEKMQSLLNTGNKIAYDGRLQNETFNMLKEKAKARIMSELGKQQPRLGTSPTQRKSAEERFNELVSKMGEDQAYQQLASEGY